MAATTFEQLYLDTPAPAPSTRCTSARAAFQAVLAGEAVLVDLRSDRERVAQGVVHPGLEPVVMSVAELGSLRGPVILLCADGRSAASGAEALRRLGLPDAVAVAGGYAAWRAAGMPTA